LKSLVHRRIAVAFVTYGRHFESHARRTAPPGHRAAPAGVKRPDTMSAGDGDEVYGFQNGRGKTRMPADPPCACLAPPSEWIRVELGAPMPAAGCVGITRTHLFKISPSGLRPRHEARDGHPCFAKTPLRPLWPPNQRPKAARQRHICSTRSSLPWRRPRPEGVFPVVAGVLGQRPPRCAPAFAAALGSGQCRIGAARGPRKAVARGRPLTARKAVARGCSSEPPHHTGSHEPIG
jgi:hypothetical protein